ncbi:MAG: FAD-dependent oxidoreductase, partial [Planctomycetota bacterium]
MGTRDVVIVGGGFCGAMIARQLDSHPAVNLTLIDSSSSHEYIPGITRIPFKAGVADRLKVPYRSFLPHTCVLKGTVTAIRARSVSVGSEDIAFDLCVIATGTFQPVQLRNAQNVHTLQRVSDALQIRAEMADAEHVLVVGGGLVGTEFAAEIATRASEKKVTVVHSRGRLL